MPDVTRLTITAQDEDHIARHGVDVDEVREVCESKPLVERTRQGRLAVWGRTDGGRLLLVVLEPGTEGRYQLVTAREMTIRERRHYNRRRRR